MTIEELKAYLELDATKKWFNRGTPYEEQKTAILAAFSANEKLLACSTMSIRLAVAKIAKYGLSVANQEVYIIPQRDVVRVPLSPQGKIKRMQEGGILVSILASATIYKGEEYEINMGKVTKHIWNEDIRELPDSERVPVAAYVRAMVNGGVEVQAIMSKKDFEARKALSTAKEGSSAKWDKFPEEGHYITCISKLYKMIGGKDPDEHDEEEYVNTETGEITTAEGELDI